MTLDQIKELRQALEGGDAAFESTFTPETCTALLDHISQLEQDAANYAFLKFAMRDGGSRWYVHEASDDDVEGQITADRIAQQDKGKEE